MYLPEHGGSGAGHGWGTGQGQARPGRWADTYTVTSARAQAWPPFQVTCSSQRSSTVSEGTRKRKRRELPYQL